MQGLVGWQHQQPRIVPLASAPGTVPCPPLPPFTAQALAGMSFVCSGVYLTEGWVKDLESQLSGCKEMGAGGSLVLPQDRPDGPTS